MDPRVWLFPVLGVLLLSRMFPIRPSGKGLLAGNGTGTSKEYGYSRDAVWAAALDVMTGLGLEVTYKDPQIGCIHAQSPMTFSAWGERIAIFLEETEAGSKTRVEVVSKPFNSMSIFPINWAKPILRNLDGRLAMQPA
jgi:hypothetical protein